MAAVMATTSASMRRTDGKTSPCSGLVWLYSVYASAISCRCCVREHGKGYISAFRQ